jgi:hypothetical protein
MVTMGFCFVKNLAVLKSFVKGKKPFLAKNRPDDSLIIRKQQKAKKYLKKYCLKSIFTYSNPNTNS